MDGDSDEKDKGYSVSSDENKRDSSQESMTKVLQSYNKST